MKIKEKGIVSEMRNKIPHDSGFEQEVRYKLLTRLIHKIKDNIFLTIKDNPEKERMIVVFRNDIYSIYIVEDIDEFFLVENEYLEKDYYNYEKVVKHIESHVLLITLQRIADSLRGE